MTTINATITTYRFDLSKEDQKQEYKALQAKLKKQVKHPFHAGFETTQQIHAPQGMEIELETKHLFKNQWNTAPIAGISEKGLRVFDWYESRAHIANGPKNIRFGHYLTLPQDAFDLRENTYQCGYCGHQSPKESAQDFCTHCLGSEYLEKGDIHLTRMQSIMDESDRPELTQEESERLIPLYIAAQVHGNTERDKARIKKNRESLEKERESSIRNAENKYAGFTWLMDRGLRTDNVIYYDHTESFCVGWRKELSAQELSEWLGATEGFPFAIDFKSV